MRITLSILLCGLVVSSFARDEAFLRIEKGSLGSDCLQVALRRYSIPEADSKTVLLVGVSHVGTESYYQKLQEILDEADVVLFEGVDGNRPEFKLAMKEQTPERSSLQVNLARALGLVFQLHHIDYSRDHFINSDLSSEQLMALFEGEEMPDSAPAAQAQMEDLLESMEQTSVSGQVAAAVLEFLEGRPGWSKGMRWSFVKILGSITGNVSQYPGLPEEMRTLMSVLIDGRNIQVMKDIHDQLERIQPGQTIAVFYGAAHMHDFEVRLENEMDATVMETEWVTAFCGNLQTSGLNILQKNLLSWFVNQQVRALKIISSPAPKTDL